MKNIIESLGFVELHSLKQVWWVKRNWEQVFSGEFSFLHGIPPSASAFTPMGGRGAIYRLPLENGGYAIARRYRRGGLIHHLTHDLYWEHPFRPLTELISTETARQRAIPTVEVLAAGVEYVAFGLYRGWFISREAEGFINLWEWLRRQPPALVRRQGVQTVAQVIAQLHTAGIYHADLNLTNILVTPQTARPQILIIDFDRARVFGDPLSSRQRKRNLRRLCRSLRKLDPQEQFFSSADLDIFCEAYHDRHPS